MRSATPARLTAAAESPPATMVVPETAATARATAFVPAVILIAIAETFNIRSIFYYAIGGALIGAIAWYMSDISIRLENTTDLSPIGYGLQLVAASGIIGGFVYWLLAGRKAGRWKNPYAA